MRKVYLKYNTTHNHFVYLVVTEQERKLCSSTIITSPEQDKVIVIITPFCLALNNSVLSLSFRSKQMISNTTL